jgi:hypothetical protein
MLLPAHRLSLSMMLAFCAGAKAVNTCFDANEVKGSINEEWIVCL